MDGKFPSKVSALASNINPIKFDLIRVHFKLRNKVSNLYFSSYELVGKGGGGGEARTRKEIWHEVRGNAKGRLSVGELPGQT